jgi:hypothetical protein
VLVLGGANLAQSQIDLANAFVQRAEFLAKYPATQDGSALVDALLTTVRNDLGGDFAPNGVFAGDRFWVGQSPGCRKVYPTSLLCFS